MDGLNLHIVLRCIKATEFCKQRLKQSHYFVNLYESGFLGIEIMNEFIISVLWTLSRWIKKNIYYTSVFLKS